MLFLHEINQQRYNTFKLSIHLSSLHLQGQFLHFLEANLVQVRTQLRQLPESRDIEFLVGVVSYDVDHQADKNLILSLLVEAYKIFERVDVDQNVREIGVHVFDQVFGKALFIFVTHFDYNFCGFRVLRENLLDYLNLDGLDLRPSELLDGRRIVGLKHLKLLQDEARVLHKGRHCLSRLGGGELRRFRGRLWHEVWLLLEFWLVLRCWHHWL